MFNISTLSKWPPVWGHDKLFLKPEVIPEVEYANKIAMSISLYIDILIDAQAEIVIEI